VKIPTMGRNMREDQLFRYHLGDVFPGSLSESLVEYIEVGVLESCYYSQNKLLIHF